MRENQTADPIELIRLKKEKMRIHAENLIRDGVNIADPERIDIHGNLICGDDVRIDINVIFQGNVELCNNVTIGANCIIKDSKIGNNSVIKPFSLVEGATIGEDTFVGPYGRIRHGSVISDSVHIGNFVEVKNTTIMSQCRINHLSFIGDAELSENVTIGAGTVSCNHNGISSSKTSIKKDAYIGSGVNLIAPLTIGSGSIIGAGSTINKDVPKNKLVIARAKQVDVKNL